MNEGFVYFIACSTTNTVKIGYSRDDPKKRLRALQTGHPFELELLLAIDGDPKFERSIHEKFKEHRLQGEWFKLCPEVLSLIGGLAAFYEATDGTRGVVFP